jgi:hypothetical protein
MKVQSVETKVFNRLIAKAGYDSLRDFCRKNEINYDPLRARLADNRLFEAKTQMLVKICAGLKCTMDELNKFFQLERLNEEEGIIFAGTPKGSDGVNALLEIAGGSKLFATPMSPTEAQLLLGLRLINKHEPTAFAVIEELITLHTEKLLRKPRTD